MHCHYLIFGIVCVLSDLQHCLLLLQLTWCLQMLLGFHYTRNCRLIFYLPLSVPIRLPYCRMKLSSFFHSSCQSAARQTTHYWQRIRTICLESRSPQWMGNSSPHRFLMGRNYKLPCKQFTSPSCVACKTWSKIGRDLISTLMAHIWQKAVLRACML